MKTRHTFLVGTFVAVLAALPFAADWPITEKIDLDAIYRIKEEGLQRSKVMDTESYLTDVYGPRLTGSPNIKEAADWAQKTMKEWGLSNVHLETFPFGRGWDNQRFVAMAVTPRAYPLIGFPKAWSTGTNGPVTGEAVLAVIQNERDFDTWRGKLRGKFVLTTTMRTVAARFEPLGRRFTDADLENLSKQPAPPDAAAAHRRREASPTRRTSSAGGPSSLSMKASRRSSTRARTATAARSSSRPFRGPIATRTRRRRRRRSFLPSSTTAESSGRWRRTFRSRCRWTSPTGFTTTT